jgi:hypothetical protein
MGDGPGSDTRSTRTRARGESSPHTNRQKRHWQPSHRYERKQNKRRRKRRRPRRERRISVLLQSGHRRGGPNMGESQSE